MLALGFSTPPLPDPPKPISPRRQQLSTLNVSTRAQKKHPRRGCLRWRRVDQTLSPRQSPPERPAHQTSARAQRPRSSAPLPPSPSPPFRRTGRRAGAPPRRTRNRAAKFDCREHIVFARPGARALHRSAPRTVPYALRRLQETRTHRRARALAPDSLTFRGLATRLLNPASSPRGPLLSRPLRRSRAHPRAPIAAHTHTARP